MSLRAFHVVFIAVSGALCLFLIGWGLSNRDSSSGAALAGIGAAGFAALAVYLRHFLRSKGGGSSNGLKPKPAVLTVLSAALRAAAAPEAHACTTCVGQVDGDSARAYFWGIFFLAALVLAVLSGISVMMYKAIQAHDAPQRGV